MNAFSAGKSHVLCAVNMIHDVIRTAKPFPYTGKFMFVGVRNTVKPLLTTTPKIRATRY